MCLLVVVVAVVVVVDHTRILLVIDYITLFLREDTRYGNNIQGVRFITFCIVHNSCME